MSNREEMSSSDESSDETNERSSGQTSQQPKENRVYSKSATLVHSLPDVFTGVYVYFKDVDQEKTKKLGRYVIAYPLMLFLIEPLSEVPIFFAVLASMS